MQDEDRRCRISDRLAQPLERLCRQAAGLGAHRRRAGGGAARLSRIRGDGAGEPRRRGERARPGPRRRRGDRAHQGRERPARQSGAGVQGAYPVPGPARSGGGRQGGEPRPVLRPRRRSRAPGQDDHDALRARRLGARPGRGVARVRHRARTGGHPHRLRRRVPAAGADAGGGGRETLLVPSSTDTASGYWRVRVGAMARALESQCVVVHAVTVGEAHWLPVASRNTRRRGGVRAAGPRLSGGRRDRASARRERRAGSMPRSPPRRCARCAPRARYGTTRTGPNRTRGWNGWRPSPLGQTAAA